MKSNNFELDWNINNLDDFYEALNAVDSYDDALTGQRNVTVKDMVSDINPELYSKLSRGDKCRLGRAVSQKHANGDYYHLTKNEKKKGVTNTYL